jgi:hypothetical protein
MNLNDILSGALKVVSFVNNLLSRFSPMQLLLTTLLGSIMVGVIHTVTSQNRSWSKLLKSCLYLSIFNCSILAVLLKPELIQLSFWRNILASLQLAINRVPLGVVYFCYAVSLQVIVLKLCHKISKAFSNLFNTFIIYDLEKNTSKINYLEQSKSSSLVSVKDRKNDGNLSSTIDSEGGSISLQNPPDTDIIVQEETTSNFKVLSEKKNNPFTEERRIKILREVGDLSMKLEILNHTVRSLNRIESMEEDDIEHVGAR